MRKTFAKSLYSQMQKDNNTCILFGDLGFGSFEELRRDFPERAINTGIAEQSMVGIAAGMAKGGKNVFCYSIIPFFLYRSYEMIRNDVCYPHLPVKFVGTGAGMSYSHAGSTHAPSEDLKVADSIPNLTILSPADPQEVEAFMSLLKGYPHPTYMRLGRSGEPQLHSKHSKIKIGKALKLTEGEKVLIVCTGSYPTKIALEVANKLNSEEDTCEVLEIHTLKPFDEEAILASSAGKFQILTIEDSTGLLEYKVKTAYANLALYERTASFNSFKLPDDFLHQVGSQEYLFRQAGISTEGIYKKVKGII